MASMHFFFYKNWTDLHLRGQKKANKLTMMTIGFGFCDIFNSERQQQSALAICLPLLGNLHQCSTATSEISKIIQQQRSTEINIIWGGLISGGSSCKRSPTPAVLQRQGMEMAFHYHKSEVMRNINRTFSIRKLWVKINTVLLCNQVTKRVNNMKRKWKQMELIAVSQDGALPHSFAYFCRFMENLTCRNVAVHPPAI